VYKWERHLAANIIAQAVDFYSQNKSYIQKLCDAMSAHAVLPDVPPALCYEVHSIRADATNSAAVHSAKAHVLKLISLFVYEGTEAFTHRLTIAVPDIISTIVYGFSNRH
jgi:hypothetical protein